MKRIIAVVAIISAVCVVWLVVHWRESVAPNTAISGGGRSPSAVPVPIASSSSGAPAVARVPPRKVMESAAVSTPISPSNANTISTSPSTKVEKKPDGEAKAQGASDTIKSDAELISSWVSPTGKADDVLDSHKVMHNRLVTEPRDDGWAGKSEQQLRNYVTANMGPERLNLVSVECASTICEMDAVGRSPDNLSADAEDWQKYLFMMANEPWWTDYQFNEPRTMVSHTPDHRALFIAFITRVQQGS